MLIVTVPTIVTPVDAGVTTFDGLTDTPSSKTASYGLRVNSGGTAIEYYDITLGATPYIDITDVAYGAVSGQNSSTAINAALAAAASAGIRTVLIPDGNFILDAFIALQSNVNLVGMGWGSILTMGDGTNLNALYAGNKSNIVLKNFKFEGNKANQSSVGRGILIAGSTNIEVSNLEMTDCYGDCITIIQHGGSINNIRIRVLDNYIHDSGFHDPANARVGIRMYNVSHSVMSRNFVDTVNDFCAQISTSSYVTLEGNTFKDPGFPGSSDCILIHTVDHINVVGNTFLGANDSGLVFERATHCNATGNTVEGSWFVGIFLSGSSYCSITGNTIQDSSQYLNNGLPDIRLSTSSGSSIHSTYNTIQGNTIISLASNKSTYGVEEVDSNQDYNNITGNTTKGQATGTVITRGANSIAANNI